MKNYRLSVSLQMDSDETATAFTKILTRTMECTARITIDIVPQPDPKIKLGKSIVAQTDSFEPN